MRLTSFHHNRRRHHLVPIDCTRNKKKKKSKKYFKHKQLHLMKLHENNVFTVKGKKVLFTKGIQ
jgi:hypothetical protein